MYLPTFWKLTTEATFYRGYHMSGYLLPIGVLCKSSATILLLVGFIIPLDTYPIQISHLGHLSISL